MRSLRRNMSAVQRDGAMESCDLSFDSRSPPKLSHGRPYMALGRMIGSLDFLTVVDRMRAAILGTLLRRSSRLTEKSKSGGLQLKCVFFHFFICFMLGFFIHFATFVSMDVSKNLASKHMSFSFKDNVMHEDAFHRKLGSVNKEVLVLDKSLPKSNHSLDGVAKYEVKKGFTEASYPIHVSPDLKSASRKLLIIVTPTYVRPFQAYYLNRLAQTLRSVRPPLMWLVVEMRSQSGETAKLLRETGVMYRHLVCNQNLTSTRYREVHQRNIALSHIEKHQLDGIVHFADDDRTYSVEIFDHMRQIRRFGTWPVAILTENKNKISLKGPVCNGSQVIGWHTSQRGKLSRRFHVDMSGFAFNSTVLWDPKIWRRPTVEPIRQHDSIKEGFQETTFIEQLLEDESEMEGLPNDCSSIMVWHLHVEDHNLLYPKGWSILENLEVVSSLT